MLDTYFKTPLIEESLLKRNLSIYRIIPLDYLLKSILEKKNTLSSILNWEDTHEGFLVKNQYKFANLKINYKGYLEGFYGQCWTLNKESDALWRIYSIDKKSVRIKSNIENIKIMISKNNIGGNVNPSIVKVKYLNSAQIYNIKEKYKSKPFITLSEARNSLMIKRKEFSHEKEIRIIIHKAQSEENNSFNERFIHLDIDPNIFIKEITFDPRLDENMYKNYELVLRQIGYKNKISQSKLYKL